MKVLRIIWRITVGLARFIQEDPMKALAALGAVYALYRGIREGAVTYDIVVAAVSAVLLLTARTQTTSLKKPRDKDGTPLVRETGEKTADSIPPVEVEDDGWSDTHNVRKVEDEKGNP